MFVRRRQDGRLTRTVWHQLTTVKFGGGGVMMWGAMSYRRTGCLRKVSERLDTKGYIFILRVLKTLPLLLLGYGDLLWYHDDGAPCHRANIVNDWKEENGYTKYFQNEEIPAIFYS